MTLRADFPEKGGKLGECTTKQTHGPLASFVGDWRIGKPGIRFKWNNTGWR